MDKLIEILLSLRDDLASLRSDVAMLSSKVDHIAESSSKQMVQNNFAEQSVPIAPQSQKSNNYNYGRPLSNSEELYISTLHSDGENESSLDNNAAKLETTPPPAPYVKPVDSMIENFFKWVVTDWPMKVGGFFIIAAVGWFVTYAARIGWLSETARVVMGYIFAVVCLSYGSLRAEKVRVQGNLFLIIGVAAMFIATLASIYLETVGMPYIVGLFVMLVSVGFVTLVSLRQKSYALTASIIFFGGLIPVFFYSQIEVNILFAYLFILTLGTLWVVSFANWRSLTTGMLGVVLLYSLAYIIDASSIELESLKNIIIAFVFVGVFYVANVSSIIRSGRSGFFDIMTAMGIGIVFLIWMLSFAPKEFEVMMLLVGILFFSSASYLIFRSIEHRAPSITYAGVSAVLFVIATALQFHGPVLATAYLVEASAFIITMMYFLQPKLTNTFRFASILLYAIPVLISFFYIGEVFDLIGNGGKYIIEDALPGLYVVFIGCIATLAIAMAAIRISDTTDKDNLTFFRIFAHGGGIYAIILIWFITHVFMGTYDVATFVALLVYTVVGVIFYVMGVREGYKPYMFVGGILFGLVVVRLLFVEFWEMDIVMRIITSFVLGALLVSTAFIRTIKK